MDNKTDQALDVILDESYIAGIDHAIEVVISNHIPDNSEVTSVLNKIITELNQIKPTNLCPTPQQ